MGPSGILRLWLRDDRGGTAIEYALIGVLIAVIVCGAIGRTGTGTNGLYGKVGSAMNSYLP